MARGFIRISSLRESSHYTWLSCFSNTVRTWVTSTNSLPRKRRTWLPRISCSWWTWTRRNLWASRFSIRSLCNTSKRILSQARIHLHFASFLVVHLPLCHSGLSHSLPLSRSLSVSFPSLFSSFSFSHSVSLNLALAISWKWRKREPKALSFSNLVNKSPREALRCISKQSRAR